MNRRREKKLCFKCGLPGYMVNSHLGGKKKLWVKKKKLDAVGPRDGYNKAPKGLN